MRYPTGSKDFYVAGVVTKSANADEYLQLTVDGLETGYFLDSDLVDHALIGRPAVLVHGYEVDSESMARGSAVSSLHPIEGAICDAQLDLSGKHVVIEDPEEFWKRYPSFSGGDIY